MILRPELLLHPNIPKPLHGLNPRTIKGQVWWDEQRHIAYAKNDYHCWSCGVHKSDAQFHKWLEGHEYYDYDYAKGRAKLKEIVALCHSCHNFIHSGKTEKDFLTRKISYSRFFDIMQHGTLILYRAKLPMNLFAYSTIRRNNLLVDCIPNKIQENDNNKVLADWSKWGIEIDGKIYKSKFKNYEEWKSYYK